jgi:hypothetical protein
LSVGGHSTPKSMGDKYGVFDENGRVKVRVPYASVIKGA